MTINPVCAAALAYLPATLVLAALLALADFLLSLRSPDEETQS